LQPFRQQREGEHGEGDGEAGERRCPPGAGQRGLRFGEQAAPARVRRLHAEAEPGQRGFGEQRVA